MVERIPLDQIQDNPYQPRAAYHKKDIDELAVSIKEHGLLQVPPGRRKGAEVVELAFGHQRVRAFRKLAKDDPEHYGEMPVDIRMITDEQMAMFSLEENMKRQDITPLETARAVDKFLVSFRKETEDGLGKKLGIAKSTISNMRRVLKLPEKFLEKIDAGVLTFTQGRELLTLDALPNGENFMSSAVSGLRIGNKSYGHSNTVEGLQASIYDTIKSHFPPLDKEFEGWRYNLLFDTRGEGCLDCEKMIRTHPTKSKTAHFCTDEDCWNKKDQAHREAAAAAAKKQMEDDVLRIAAAGKSPVKEKAEDYRIQNLVTRQWWEGMAASVDDACDTAGWKKEDCWVRVKTEAGGWSNRFGHMPIEVAAPKDVLEESEKTDEEIQEEIAVVDNADAIAAGEKTVAQVVDATKAPDDLLEKAKKAAGTRADVIDLRPLRVSDYYEELKSGYSLLDEDILANVEDPGECLERCTEGFHYAFDSKFIDRGTRAVCSNPKCLARKKTAMTRKRNAAGQALKKAESAAIKQAIAGTTTLDKNRMKLILLAQMDGVHTERYHWGQKDWKEPETWLWDKLSPGIEKGKRERKALWKLIDKITAEELAALVVEFMFYSITYKGGVGDYETKASQPLKWLGIKVEIPEKEEPANEKVESV
jgi:ParB/RepB/Spo0J family partition protein